jgi:Tfp pilus assembly protein PilN
MRRTTLLVIVVSLSVMGYLAPGLAQTGEDLKQLRQDIEAIKQGQEAMRQDLEEIKKLLQPRQPPPPVQALDAVLEIGDAPLKGNQPLPTGSR